MLPSGVRWHIFNTCIVLCTLLSPVNVPYTFVQFVHILICWFVLHCIVWFVVYMCLS